MQVTRIRVLLADDHALVRSALGVVLAREPDIDVAAEAGGDSEALRLAKELKPDVVIMDIGMPDMNGIEATRELGAAVPRARVLALSTHVERYYVTQMLEAGARGYIVKTSDTEELLRAIRAVARNQVYLGAEIAWKIANWARQSDTGADPDSQRLGNRERQVLSLLAEGKTSEEIAGRLRIAPSTVVAHRRNISRKLGLHSVAELTKYAIRKGLTSS